MERLERYSRDFKIRVIGVAEQDGDGCLLIIPNSHSHFLASKKTLAKLRMPTVLEKTRGKSEEYYCQTP